MRIIAIDKEKCKICDNCISAECCPAEAITQQFDEPPIVDDTDCVNCGKCVNVCPFGAVYWHDDGEFELNKFARKLK